MADESSEGRRYSYKPKKKKPVERPKRKESIRDYRVQEREGEAKRRAKTRQDKRSAVVVTGAGGGRRKASDKERATVTNFGIQYTPLDKERIRSRVEGWKRGFADESRIRKYDNIPHPIVEQKRPPGGPAPMIEPNVGPVGQLREQAAHTHGYTPEAYKELRNVPIRMAPPVDEYEKSVGGYYSPDGSGSIYLNPSFGPDYARDTVAHEQGHAMWQNRGYEMSPAQEQYRGDIARWRNEDYRPNGTVGNNVGRMATDDMWLDRPAYDNTSPPTESYARSIEYNPGDASSFPDYMKPYYSGFLRGADTLSNGQPTPPVPDAIPMTPDENGMYGNPPPRWPYPTWR